MQERSTSQPHQMNQDMLADIKRADYFRYLALLRAPRALKPVLLTLTMFHHTLSEIAETVSDPMIGAIRLSWWRESLEEIAQGHAPRNHPLLHAIAQHSESGALSLEALIAMIAERDCDLDASLLETEARFIVYIDGTIGALHSAWAHALSMQVEQSSACVSKLSRGYAMMRLLRAIPALSAKGLLRFPADMMAEQGLTHTAHALARPSEQVQLFTHHLLGKAQLCLSMVEPYRTSLPAPFRVLLMFAKRDAAMLSGVAYNPYHNRLLKPRPLSTVWQAMRA